MKKILLIFCVLLLNSMLFAQNPGNSYFLIHFRDKGLNTNSISDPNTLLTQKALDRRSKQFISLDESDLPVNEKYVQTLVAMNARIVARSRWFNYVVAEANPQLANKFAALDFVSGCQKLNNSVSLQNEFSQEKFFQPTKQSDIKPGPVKSSNSNLYNYGSAANQINMMKGEFLHNMGFSGQGMTIAVIDAGFNSADVMPAFDSLRINNQIKGVHNFVNSEDVYNTSISSHGTMVLSTMGANIPGDMVGTAPKADYWLLRSEDAVSEYILEEYYWVSAAEFADSVGADVINSSLGYTTFDDPTTNHTYEDMDGNTTYITIGADKAAEKGILVVNSAGNSGGSQWHYIGAPADGDSVFTIGAVDGSGSYAYFSSVGPTYDGRIKPTVSAQGLNATVYSPWGLGYGSGTSFSSPIMAGMSACLWQAAPSLTSMQILDAIRYTASQAATPDNTLGWGIPDFSSAYGVLGSAGFANAEKASFTAGPNPFNESLTLTFRDNLIGKVKFELYSILGKIVLSKEMFLSFPQSRIVVDDLNNLPHGSYLLHISANNVSFSKIVLR